MVMAFSPTLHLIIQITYKLCHFLFSMQSSDISHMPDRRETSQIVGYEKCQLPNIPKGIKVQQDAADAYTRLQLV